MGTENNAAPTIDQKALQDAVVAALPGVLQAALPAVMKPLQDEIQQLRQQQQQPAADKSAGEGKSAEKPLTMADVQKVITDALSNQQKSVQQNDAKRQFVESNLKDLPAAYRRQLGDDPANWSAEEQEIRKQFQSDFKTSGGKVEDKGGDQPGGTRPSETVDMSKVSPTQAIAMGLKKPNANPNPAAATEPAK